MKKISINHAWLFWLIPLCMFVFVGFPQLKRTYNLYEKRVQKYEQEKVELDSLRQANVTSLKAKHRLKTLEITVPVTLSIGIANFSGEVDKTIDALFEQADQALYAAKEAGRNRVKVWEAK